MVNVTKNGSITEGLKVDGVKYMDDQEASEYLRLKRFDTLYDFEGNVITPSASNMTNDEKQIRDEQKIKFGKYKNDTLKQFDTKKELGNVAKDSTKWQPVRYKTEDDEFSDRIVSREFAEENNIEQVEGQ